MLRRPTNELLIKPRVSKKYRALVIAGAVIILLGLLFAAFQYGRHSGNTQLVSDQDRNTILKQEVQQLTEQHRASENKLMFAQRQQQIQEEAYKQMSDAYAGAEKKNRYLTSRVDFYRSIISPRNNEKGPRIHDLSYTTTAGQISFDVTLVQSIKHKHQVRATIRAFLVDTDNQVLASWPETSGKTVNFQYFQNASGTFKVSEISEGLKIKVELAVDGGKIIERWFDIIEQ